MLTYHCCSRTSTIKGVLDIRLSSTQLKDRLLITYGTLEFLLVAVVVKNRNIMYNDILDTIETESRHKGSLNEKKVNSGLTNIIIIHFLYFFCKTKIIF